MSQKAWLIRPKPHDQVRIHEFLEEGFIAVGWPNIGDLTGLREPELRERIQQVYGETNSGLATLKIMVYRMKQGDYVVVPYEGAIYFGKIMSDYMYDATKDNSDLGYPHQRKVEWYDVVLERHELPEGLQKSTRVVRTAAELTPHVNTIARLVGDAEAEEVESYFTLQEPVYSMSEPDMFVKEDAEWEDDLVSRAKEVLEEELENPDPMVRLRAAEIIMGTRTEK